MSHQEFVLKLHKALYFLNLLVVFLFAVPAFAQAPDTAWTRVYGGSSGDLGNSVKQDTDGGFIIAGTTNSFGAGESDAWLIKTDSDGGILWSKTYGQQFGDGGYAAERTVDGGYALVGYTETQNISTFVIDTWLVKTTSDGSTEWTRKYNYSDDGRGYHMQQTVDKGFIIAGNGDLDNGTPLVLKVDSTGNLEWDKLANGGMGNESHWFILETSDGGFIVSGWNGIYGGQLQKYKSNGDLEWWEIYTNTAGIRAMAVQEIPGEGYIVTGNVASLSGNSDDVWLMKIDNGGSVLWSKGYGGGSKERGNSIIVTSDGDYVVAGFTQSFGNGQRDLWVLKTDSNGDTLWTKTVGGERNDVGNSIQQASDGGYVVAGSSASSGMSDNDVWLVKLKSDLTTIDNTSSTIPSDHKLLLNYPNPFNPRTAIQYEIGNRGHVIITIYDISGRRITTLVDQTQNAGKYEVVFDASDLSSGVYFYELQVDRSVYVNKMTYLR